MLKCSTVTPLGLYQALLPADVRTPDFKYFLDTSPFGYGTPPRSNLSFNRLCGTGTLMFGPLPCPFTDDISILTKDPNGTIIWDFPNGINRTLPNILTNAFSSGTDEKTTISNFFDISYRRYIATQDWLTNSANNGSEFLVGAFRSIQSLIMEDSLVAVEGLVVDARNGGVGFRNQ